jgi:hypothetical protein
MFFCAECDELTDRGEDGCEVWEGQLVCEHCWNELCQEEATAMHDPFMDGDWASPGRGLPLGEGE